VAAAALLFVGAALTAAETRQPVPANVGSKACAGCHAATAEAWKGSHHDWAWNVPNETTVLGDFEDATFHHKGITTRFSIRDERYIIETDGHDGELTEFEVKYTVGVEPLQQYLVETAPGRLQALDIVWDTEQRRWYHLYPDQQLEAGDGLHWTGPYKNWNARCAECHATGFQKNYDPRTETYESRQAEKGVACEACHGPGEAHVTWAEDAVSFDQEEWQSVNGIGLAFAFDPGDAKKEIELCAGCHARREPLGGASPLPGTAFADSYRLALLREGLYHPDGQILDEVYVYGSFLQSRMFARGVRCTNCHEPHSGNLIAEGNEVCTQCHNPDGNPAFPTLPKTSYDSPSHHFHESGTAGAQCTGCHMPERFYMVIDGRRDHSFRVPRPDLSVKIGTPNACTDCHDDQRAAWAARQVKSWYPSGRSDKPHYSEVIAAARQRLDDRGLGRLTVLAKQKELPGIVRATALDLLSRAPSPSIAEDLAGLLGDSDPVVRAAAVASQRGAPATLRAQRLLPLLQDPVRSVRIETARNLLDIPVVRFPPKTGALVRDAMGEYQTSLIAKSDFPEAQMVIAGTALTLRNFGAAEAAFARAVSLDPQLADAWLMLARLQAERNSPAAASETLSSAIAANPNDGILLQSLGNVLISAGRHRDALGPLEKAGRLLPDNPFIAADLGLLLSHLGQPNRALSQLEKTLGSTAESPDVLLALVSGYVAEGYRTKAERTLWRLELLYPDSPLVATARQLLQ
jgi:predicted CXXCH cytochrome family protein